METCKFIASLPAGSEIAFDYGVLPSMLTERQRIARERRARRAAAIGEPWITYFDPASLARDLGAIGFRQVEDLGPEEANDRYFKGRLDGLRVGESGRLMTART